MKNITEMRQHLATLYEDLKCGAIEPKLASEMNNTAGKIINSLRVELDYAGLQKKKPSIDFLNQALAKEK